MRRLIMMVDPERNHQLIMFSEIYRLGKDSDAPDDNENGDNNDNNGDNDNSDGEGYTMDFGSLEKEAGEPTSMQTGRKRKSDAISESSRSDEAEKSNRSDRPSSSMRAQQGRRISRYYCQEEGCDKHAVVKGRCIRHAREHGDTRTTSRARCKEEGCEKQAQGKGGRCKAHGGGYRCKEEGCDKQACVKGRCKSHAREHRETTGDP